ncbi:MAG: hypothetical protein EHM23_30935 [Acidobacteria bacterium]|nr:MAG: hypothetical protein EHM23_30935 [Acidobacteriota bacterium]
MIALSLGLLMLLAPQGEVTSARQFTIQDVAWIKGCWEGGDADSRITEQWMAPQEGTMFGASRTTKNGKMVDYEYLMIRVNEAGEIHYLAKPSRQPESAFKLVRVGTREAVFENPEHDFPQRIIYRVKEDGSLHARIEGMSNGQVKGVDFPMKKVPCE